MYQADFICTYRLMDNENDQEQMYRIQLLQAFDLNVLDDNVINTTIQELYAKLKDSPEFKEIFTQARENKMIIEILELLNLSDDDIIFQLLFKFEYFDLLHRCIVDFLLNGSVDAKYSSKLLAELQQIF